MKSRETLTIILAISLILGSYHTFAQTAEELLPKGIQLEEVKGELEKAIEVYQTIVTKFSANRPISSKALFHIGLCYEKLGDAQAREARKAYERVVRDYADQSEVVSQAQKKLLSLNGYASTKGLITRRVLTDACGVDGILTPDGKFIRSLDWQTGDVNQYEIASEKHIRITNKGPWKEGENWYEGKLFSRDGKQITYTSSAKEKDWVLQLRIRNLDGTGLRTLLKETDSYVRLLDWSPEAGSILALLERKSTNWTEELTLISTIDGSVRILKSFPSSWDTFKMAKFSPDGRFIAYSALNEDKTTNCEVFLMTVDGQNKVVVAGHPADDQLLGWTPDGRSLLFLSDRSGTWDIWSARINGGKQLGEPIVLKKDFGEDSKVLGLSTDGSFYYKTSSFTGRLFNAEIDLETGKVLVPPLLVTTRYTGPKVYLGWSPDGGELAYLSIVGPFSSSNNKIITIKSATTGEERFLITRLLKISYLSWAPDCRSFIVIGLNETGKGIFRIDAETGENTMLVKDDDSSPYLCPDGKTLVSWRDGTIKKRNLNSGEVSEIIKADNTYILSPNGREVVFQKDSVLKIMSLSGGESRELIRGLGPYYSLKWTRDGRYILGLTVVRKVTPGNEIMQQEIWRIPLQDGAPLKLDLPELSYFDLNEDNRRFAFSTWDEAKSELWVLENFLPK